MDLSTLPPQPGEDRWTFVEELRSPMWRRHNWTPRQARDTELGLSEAVRLTPGFPDPEGALETAYADLCAFLAAGGVDVDGDGVEIVTAEAPVPRDEAYRIHIEPNRCRIEARNTEGIRRGIFHIEDQMLSAGGPFLPLGTIERTPHVLRRISRCFFGPIKRPPKMRDELMDDVDYYPDGYLNRLAHDGVNGLWLTTEFRDLCRTRFTPEAGKDAGRRLAKLCQTVKKCLRYGIRTYIFCIEPRAWDADSPVLTRHPELAGGASYGNKRCFCPTSDAAQEYLYESVNSIFSAVPGLGGLINISHGERATTCLSAVAATGEGRVTCPRCADKQPWEILHASLSAMEKGMHAAAPDADLISWLYMPQAYGPDGGGLADWVYEIPAHTPDGVILQFNFETGVRRDTFGRELTGGDYWLSNPGPSDRFERVAGTARSAGTAISAKIQTGCSHEVASIPFVPIPAQIHAKFSGMRQLDVTHTMLCWYFGNYPGLMNKAAGELSFEPFPADVDEFLLHLARICWRDDAARVVEAWRCFSRGYENYPLTNLFQYYGPIHDGVVWPLLLKPEDAPLSPTWLLGSTTTLKPWPPSGDRVGECMMSALALDETVELCRLMSDHWQQGVEILLELEPSYRDEPERLLDIGLARALGIQFRTGYNNLRFYALRERMFRMDGPQRLELLEEMGQILQEEVRNGETLLPLCERDSRLGFHSEAEGYKYFPEKIRWRVEQLRRVLTHDVREVAQTIERGDALFPEYTGLSPVGPQARCRRWDQAGGLWRDPDGEITTDLDWNDLEPGARWTLAHDGENLYAIAEGPGEGPSSLLLKVEPRRLWPCKHFAYGPASNARRVEVPDRAGPQLADGIFRPR